MKTQKFKNSKTQNLKQDKCLSSSILLKYSDNILTEKENYQIEKHLLDCQMCQDVLDGILELPNKNKLPVIITQLNNQIDKKNLKKGKVIKLNTFKILAMAASFILLIGLSIFIGKYFTGTNEMTMAENLNYNVEKTTTINKEVTQEEKTEDEEYKEGNIVEKTEIINNEDLDDEFSDEIIIEDVVDAMPDEKAEGIIKAPDYEMDMNEQKEKAKGDIIEKDKADKVNNIIIADDEAIATDNIAKKDEITTDNIGKGEEILAEEVSTTVTRNSIFKRNKKSEGKAFSGNTTQPANQKAEYISIESNIDTGIYLYNNQQYTEAVNNFSFALEEEPTNSTATFYTAQCYQETGKNIKSLMYYNQITNDKNNEFYYNAQFNTALLYIELGLKNKAEIILDELSSKENQFKKDAEIKLLEIRK